jgi:hypothetical protein
VQHACTGLAERYRDFSGPKVVGSMLFRAAVVGGMMG